MPTRGQTLAGIAVVLVVLAAMAMIVGLFSTWQNAASKSSGAGASMGEPQDLTNRIRNAQVGDTIHFGTVSFTDYWGGSFSDDIGWRVLAVEDGRVLIVSEDVVDMRPYNDADEATTWEQCSLRQWLNSNFYDSLPQEMKDLDSIAPQVENYMNPGSGVDGGSFTNDFVFILSWDEVNQYFSSGKDRQAGLDVTPEVVNGIMGKYGADLQGIAQSSGGGAFWWMRTPGNAANCAGYVAASGAICGYGTDVDADSVGVRPAIWLSR